MPNLINRAIGAAAGKPISLLAQVTTDDNYMTFESPVGTDYSVPASTIFKITRMIYRGAAGKVMHIGYANDGVADGAAAPTAPVYLIGNGTNSPIAVTTTTTVYSLDIYAEVPAGKFPFLRAGGTGTANGFVQLLGVEEAA